MRAVKESMPANADPIEEQLLNLLGALWYEGKKVTVLEAMDLLPEISSSTMHRRLKTLRQKGFISLEMDEFDNRVKYVVATPIATEYFLKLGQSIKDAGKETGQPKAELKTRLKLKL